MSHCDSQTIIIRRNRSIESYTPSKQKSILISTKLKYNPNTLKKIKTEIRKNSIRHISARETFFQKRFQFTENVDKNDFGHELRI